MNRTLGEEKTELKASKKRNKGSKFAIHGTQMRSWRQKTDKGKIVIQNGYKLQKIPRI